MTRPDVLVTRPIMEAPLARLRERCDVTVDENDFGIPREDLLKKVAGRDALITMLTEKVDAELLAAAGPQLRIVANHAVGFDNVVLADCTAAGVLASNTPDVLTETTADTAFALLMAAARRVGEGERFLRRREPWIWGPLMMLGQDVHHKTIGIVGFGRIGQAVARRAKGFGMDVHLHRRGDAAARGRGRDGRAARRDRRAPARGRRRLDPHEPHARDPAPVRRRAVPRDEADGDPREHLARAGRRRGGARRRRSRPARSSRRGSTSSSGSPRCTAALLDLENAVVIPHLGERDGRHARRDGPPRRRQRVRRARRRAPADPAQPRGVHGAVGRARRAERRRARPAPDALRRDVRLLTTLLGDAIRAHDGRGALRDGRGAAARGDRAARAPHAVARRSGRRRVAAIDRAGRRGPGGPRVHRLLPARERRGGPPARAGAPRRAGRGDVPGPRSATRSSSPRCSPPTRPRRSGARSSSTCGGSATRSTRSTTRGAPAGSARTCSAVSPRTWRACGSPTRSAGTRRRPSTRSGRRWRSSTGRSSRPSRGCCARSVPQVRVCGGPPGSAATATGTPA